jgi:hypothetical protein
MKFYPEQHVASTVAASDDVLAPIYRGKKKCIH